MGNSLNFLSNCLPQQQPVGIPVPLNSNDQVQATSVANFDQEDEEEEDNIHFSEEDTNLQNTQRSANTPKDTNHSVKLNGAVTSMGLRTKGNTNNSPSQEKKETIHKTIPNQVENTNSNGNGIVSTTSTPSLQKIESSQANTTNTHSDVDLFADMAPIYKAPPKIVPVAERNSMQSNKSNNSEDSSTSNRLHFAENDTENQNWGWNSNEDDFDLEDSNK